MRNRMTFANVIGILLENSNKTYPQHLLIRNLFSECLDDTLPASEILDGERIEYSRWCTGARPVTVAIINSYEPDNWDTMESVLFMDWTFAVQRKCYRPLSVLMSGL